MKRNKTKSREKRQAHVLHHVLTHLINSQVDLISYFQAPIQSSYVEHVASSDLNVLHSEFCFLYKEGNASCEQGERPRGDIIQLEVCAATGKIPAESQSGVCAGES